MSSPHYLPEDLWAQVQSSMPILCVDILPIHRQSVRKVELINRRFPDGRAVWCHLGGRVHYGETTDEALRRHLTETLVGVDGITFSSDPQPDHVMQWFPPSVRSDATYGDDPRKHAVGLTYVVEVPIDVVARKDGEGTDFAWFDSSLADADPLWPGTAHLVSSVLSQSAGARTIRTD